ncbi:MULTISPECIES: nucleotidyl transferase AbiEii/AbiGii toxin family protein [Streptomyces]|uniref:Uncharacterized protein n=1 Tax=Streptomyces morookaense TaxID=1970 RepID=A0A7Y7E836_STRMO|nr:MULTISPECIES: nucleotidyl transferase AbiEii/AbiGii toxin family protein [Streptomyces]MCC2274102.1 nucleotidyl transferase AbiEii/AbiGii toxin family protein [Streptomyces sp. ET3-23]NVK78902.1 hypothetical protein [Streptomyces morookaense]GHF35918.1 hypothetical protein GCM10010359_43340 [Streptomyces morookaense]
MTPAPMPVPHAERGLAAWAAHAGPGPGQGQAAQLPSGPREAEKKRITGIALAAVAPATGLRLGGSRALVLHGLTERLTDDIDLFAPPGRNGYQQAVVDALRAAGYDVAADVTDSGATLVVTTASGEQVDLEMASSLPLKDAPAMVDGIPVMSVADCVRLKFGAVCSSKPRDKDLIDIHGIFERLGPDYIRQLDVNPLLLAGFFRSLKRAGDVGDETFAGFGVPPERAARIRQDLVQQSGRADEVEAEILAQFNRAQPKKARTARKHPWWTCLMPCCGPQDD